MLICLLICWYLLVRIRLGGVQTVVGGRLQGLPSRVVELVGLHHAFPLPLHIFPASSCLPPFSESGEVLAQHSAAHPVARSRSYARLRRGLCHRQRLQFRSDHLSVPGESTARTSSDLTRMHAHRHRKVLLYLLPRHHFLRLRPQPTILFLLSHRKPNRSQCHSYDRDVSCVHTQRNYSGRQRRRRSRL